MSNSTNSYTYSNLRLLNKCGNSTTNTQNIQKYKQIFGDESVFTSVKPGEKAGFKGWNEPDKLLTPDKAQFVLNRNRNIAIRLGIETDRGYTVCFDKESYGVVQDTVINKIEEDAVSSWESQSGGYNNLLTVTEEAYEHLSQYKQKVTFEGDKHDLELLTSGYALVPPSRVGDNRYDDLEIYPQAPTVDLDSVRQILESIPVDEKEERTKGNSHTNDSSSNTDTELKELPPDFDIESHFRENVAYFAENMDDKKSHFLQFIQELKNNQPRIKEKWGVDPEDRSKNEKKLAIDFAWYTQNDTKTIQYIFEYILPVCRDNELKYHENKTHREDCLNLDQYVSRPYWVQGLSFSFRQQLATTFFKKEELTLEELSEGRIFNTRNSIESYSEKHIERGLELFEELGLIEEISEDTYRNKSIDKEYVEVLNELCENDEYKPIKYPNESD